MFFTFLAILVHDPPLALQNPQLVTPLTSLYLSAYSRATTKPNFGLLAQKLTELQLFQCRTPSYAPEPPTSDAPDQFVFKLSELCSILVYGGHFVFWRPFCFLLRFYSLQIERVMLNFILWRPFYLLVAILLFGGHFIFDFWLRVVKIYFHAKLQDSSLKIEVFGSLFFWRPFYFLQAILFFYFHIKFRPSSSRIERVMVIVCRMPHCVLYIFLNFMLYQQ